MSDMKSDVIRRLQATRGDDLYRAQAAFRGTDMGEMWGQSGKTKRQILSEYQKADDELTACIRYVEENLK